MLFRSFLARNGGQLSFRKYSRIRIARPAAANAAARKKGIPIWAAPRGVMTRPGGVCQTGDHAVLDMQENKHAPEASQDGKKSADQRAFHRDAPLCRTIRILLWAKDAVNRPAGSVRRRRRHSLQREQVTYAEFQTSDKTGRAQAAAVLSKLQIGRAHV